MVLKKRPGIMLGIMSKVGITSRLTVTLMLYAAVSLLLVIALVTMPWLAAGGVILAAVVFDWRRAACRRKAECVDAAQDPFRTELPVR